MGSTRTSPVRRLTVLSLSLSLSLVLSYLETFIPLPLPIPGIKLGLGNLAILFLLCRYSFRDAAVVSALRVVLSNLLFGNVESMAFAAGGALLSLVGMALLRKTPHFSHSVIGASVCGGVLHNVGQIAVACLITEQIAVATYLPVLLISGTLAGILVGVLAGMILLRVGRASGTISGMKDGPKDDKNGKRP